MEISKEERINILKNCRENINQQLLDYLYKVEHRHIILFQDRKLVVENLKLLKIIEEELNNV